MRSPYAWTQTAGTAVTLQGANTAAASFVAPGAATSLGIQLTVSDSKGLSSTAQTTVAITASTPTSSSGCGCSETQGAPSTMLVLALAGMWMARRRRSAS